MFYLREVKYDPTSYRCSFDGSDAIRRSSGAQ